MGRITSLFLFLYYEAAFCPGIVEGRQRIDLLWHWGCQIVQLGAIGFHVIEFPLLALRPVRKSSVEVKQPEDARGREVFSRNVEAAHH